jgi:hypothetical protein
MQASLPSTSLVCDGASDFRHTVVSCVVRKLHAGDKKAVDKAIGEIAGEPIIGKEKKSGLAEVFVYKLKTNKQETLLAYRLQPNKLKPREFVLLSLGLYENFYSDMERQGIKGNAGNE